jgi:branched-chain amino acid transport system permease protein
MNPNRKRMAWTAAIVAVLALVPAVAGSFTVSLLNDIGIGALVALGLVLLTGVGGATSFGQAAFVGIAAYATAWLTTTQGMSPWIGLLFALLLTGLSALAIGMLTLRLGGHFLPLSTIAWGLSIAMLFGNVDALGRHTGLSNIPALQVAGWSLAEPRAMYYLIWVMVGLACLFSHNLLQSRPGRAIRGLRGGATLLASVGADAYRVRLSLFVTAALFAGLAGWLYAHMNRFVSPSPFDVRASIEYLLMAVAGGLGQLAGALVGAALVLVLKNGLQDVLPLLTQRAGQLEAVAFAALFILLLHFARGGVMGLLRGWTRRWTTRRGATQGPSRHDAAPVAPLAQPHLARARHAGAVGQRRGQALRRAGGGERRELRREGRRDRRAHRAERRGQVDHVQPADLHAAHERGPGALPGPRHRRHAAARGGAPGPGAHLPAREAAPAHEPSGQRGAGRAFAHALGHPEGGAAAGPRGRAADIAGGAAPARPHRPG